MLRNNPGARKKRKRVGRGTGSGHGKTSCRGHKGQKARSGATMRIGFEGGQMPLIRRIPKRGFRSPLRQRREIVNVAILNLFDEGSVVDVKALAARGLVKGHDARLKILGDGEITRKLEVVADAFSDAARKKIEAAGGAAILAGVARSPAPGKEEAAAVRRGGDSGAKDR